MSKKKTSANTIDNFLGESIASHEWLEDKDKANAPFGDAPPYVQIYNLATQYQLDGEYDPAEVTKVGRIAKHVVNDVKRQMMLGKSLEHIKETIIDPLSPELKIATKKEVIKAIKEFPLLGSVYIEPTVFDKGAGVKGCKDGATQLSRNQSKMATQAVKMAKCDGCSFNQGGCCRLYKKSLVAQPKYDDKTLEHYKNHLILSSKIASNVKVESKEDLKKALLLQKKSDKKAFPSVVYHDPTKIPDKKATPFKKIVSKEKRDIIKDLSFRLASGHEPKEFKNYVTARYKKEYKQYPEIFKRYANYIGSLGRVFVELDPFDTFQEAKKFIDRYARAVPYILMGENRLSDVQKKAFPNKKFITSLKEIPENVWIYNLRGKVGFDIDRIQKTPLFVTRTAFLNQPKQKITKSDFMELDKVSDVTGAKFMAKDAHESTHLKPKTRQKMSKVAKTSSDNIKVNGKKVTAKVDGFYIEIEGYDLDDRISKYL